MNTEHSGPAAGQEKETGRIEAFSDGVFAIAITLLVLDLKMPHPEGAYESADLLKALLAQWPSYLAFAISFITILIMWVNHHSLFTHIKRSDGLFLFLNGMVLLTVTFVPFPTALLAEYIRHPQANIAAALYAGTFLCNCAIFTVLWRYASRKKRLLDKDMAPGLIQGIKRQGMTGVALYMLALGLAFVSVPVSVSMCLLLAVFFAVTGSMHRILIGK